MQDSFEFRNIAALQGIGELLKQTSSSQPFLDAHIIGFLFS